MVRTVDDHFVKTEAFDRRPTSSTLRVGCTVAEITVNLLGITRTAQGSAVFEGIRMTSGESYFRCLE